MNDKRSARPVSGEIMTDGATASPETAKAARMADTADIVDAEYETVASGRSAPRRGPREEPRTNDEPKRGLDMLKGSEAPRRILSEPGGPAFWTFGAILVFASFWISGGHALMRDVPGFGRQAAEPSLRIASVESRVETHGGRDFLFIDGHATNDGETVRTLPSLSINVRGADGMTTRYFLGTSDRPLEPGERFNFSSRLLAPKDGVKSVSVTFRKDG